ncbi:GSCOCG00011821001-RA-CDS [Cotesia congregata]|nr:GSCOCG00011821001-RA-CDS [Cotesia congregata]
MLKTIEKVNTVNMNGFRTQMLRNILESYEQLSTLENAENGQISKEITNEMELSIQQQDQRSTSLSDVYLYQSAHYHQGSLHLFHHQQAGLQCTAIATYAIAALPNHLSSITMKDLDDILIGGDQYYLQCRAVANMDMLNIDELLPTFLVKNKLIVISEKKDVSYGSLLDENPLTCLNDSIVEKIETKQPTIKNDCGYLFITQGKTVAFKHLYLPHSGGHEFFLFNSHAVDNNNCLPEDDSDGKARLFRCCGSLALAKALLAGTNLNCDENYNLWGLYKITFLRSPN